MANITAQLIATLIQANCDAHLSGAKSREDWNAEQIRLWDLAAKRRCVSKVARLVAPPIVKVPPYSVRKQLREATLAVGR